MSRRPLNLLECASAAGEFDLFVAAVEACNLDGILESEGPLTLLAPTDAAFGGLTDDMLSRLLDRHSDDLHELVYAHVVRGAYGTQHLACAASLQNLRGRTLAVDALGSALAVGGAVLTRPDLQASNGIVHGVNRVLRSTLQSGNLAC